jgi:hypothetical protein
MEAIIYTDDLGTRLDTTEIPEELEDEAVRWR